MPIKIRITKCNLSETELISTILSFTKNPDKAIIVKEHIPYDHYHVYLEDSLSCPTIRNRLSKICVTKNNDSYSVSENHTDWKGYMGYLVKHENTTILHCNFNIQELRDYYLEKSKTKKKYTEYSEIYSWVMSKCETDSRTPRTPDSRTIAKKVCEFYLEKQKILHKAHIAQIVQTIYYQNKGNNERFITSILEEADLQDDDGDELNHLRIENKNLKHHLRDYLRRQEPE